MDRCVNDGCVKVPRQMRKITGAAHSCLREIGRGCLRNLLDVREVSSHGVVLHGYILRLRITTAELPLAEYSIGKGGIQFGVRLLIGGGTDGLPDVHRGR